MRNGLVRRLAFVADERVELDADRAKAILFARAAIGTDAIALNLRQLFHFEFCSSAHDDAFDVDVGVRSVRGVDVSSV